MDKLKWKKKRVPSLPIFFKTLPSSPFIWLVQFFYLFFNCLRCLHRCVFLSQVSMIASYGELRNVCLYIFVIPTLFAHFFIISSRVFLNGNEPRCGMGKKLILRENNDVCVCFIQPFSSHTLPSFHRKRMNIPSNASLLVLVWLSEGFFYQLTFPPTLFFWVSPSCWLNKKPEEKANSLLEKIILETFVGENEEEQEEAVYFIFYSTPRSINSRKGKTFESSRRPIFLQVLSVEFNFLRNFSGKDFCRKISKKKELSKNQKKKLNKKREEEIQCK